MESVLGSGSAGFCPTTVGCYSSQCLERGHCGERTGDPGFPPVGAVPPQTRQGHTFPRFERAAHQPHRKRNRTVYVCLKLNTGSRRSLLHALEMGNSLILRAVKYMSLPQWSSKPVELGSICEVLGTTQTPQCSKPASPQGMFGRVSVSHNLLSVSEALGKGLSHCHFF